MIAVLLLAAISAAGAYLFKSLGNPEGLTSSQITCIMKDSRGFMWFGTPSGLYRYDGYTFRNFQCDPKDGSSLPDSYIKSVQEALDGNLLINTTSGYCIYNPQNETFERDIRAYLGKMGMRREAKLLFIDSKHNLWAYTPNRGVECFNMQKQLLYNFGYSSTKTGIPQGNIIGMGESKEGTILIYETGRLVCCDVSNQQHTVWANAQLESQGMKRKSDLHVFTDSRGIVWLYGPGMLLGYNPDKQTWDTSTGNKLGFSSTERTDQNIYGMDEDSIGNVWIGSDVKGLVRMDVRTHEMEQVKPVSMKTQKMINDGIIRILSVYVDNTNLLWVGTQKFGVAYWGKNIYKFESDDVGDVTAMAEDASGKMWYGTEDNGVIGISSPLASSTVSAMAFTKDGSLWVGSLRNGITRIKNGESRIYSTARDSGRTVIDDHINALTSDKNGNLWIATNGGLQVFNATMESFSTYTKENGKLMTNDITALHYGKSNKMIVGTANGLLLMNLSSNEMTYLTGNTSNLKTFTNNYISSVYEDSRGLIWVGTREGINILDMETDDLNYITEEQGLCNNSVCGITEDKDNSMWITTTKGAAKIVVERNSEDGSFSYGIFNYDSSDGLASNEFNPRALLTRKNGQVILGNMRGVNWVRKTVKGGKTVLPSVILSQLLIDDVEIEAGKKYQGEIPLPVALNETNKITLSGSNNSFIIKFAAGNYNQSEHIQFMYWLEGRDAGWKNADPLVHGIKVKNLSTGKYTLHVKAVGSDGSISDKERTLKITIERPWWLSWWMIALYVLILALLIYMWRSGWKRINNIWRKKRQVINELRSQREEIKMASEDLRKPMARMTSIIGSLAETETTVEGREKLNSLHSQLLQLITRISEMQIALENPQAKAKSRAEEKLVNGQLGDDNVLIGENGEEELTYEIKPQLRDLPTKKFLVIFIDNNEEFLRFMKARLGEFYTFETYSDILKAASDLEDLKADLVVCKQDMPGMTGSELCNKLKTNIVTESTKFVLLTDQVLAPADIKKQNITLSADDYLTKPFNIQEAMVRFNQLLGIGDVDMDNIIDRDSIKGDDKYLEFNNSSMTTAKLDYERLEEDDEDEHIVQEHHRVEAKKVEEPVVEEPIVEEHRQEEKEVHQPEVEENHDDDYQNDDDDHVEAKTFVAGEVTIAKPRQKEKETKNQDDDEDAIDILLHGSGAADSKKPNTDLAKTHRGGELQMNMGEDYNMMSAADRQLLLNVEAYVTQNMSRGQINLEEMSSAMGMGRVPFFHKITAITHKTPAELIREIRLKHACELLEKTNISMHEIALNVGFVTSENFIHIFKEKLGVTPLEYRMRKRK